VLEFQWRVPVQLAQPAEAPWSYGPNSIAISPALRHGKSTGAELSFLAAMRWVALSRRAELIFSSRDVSMF
jgi:hypothetical protein